MEHYSQLICIFPETADKRPGAQLRLTPPPLPSSLFIYTTVWRGLLEIKGCDGWLRINLARRTPY